MILLSLSIIAAYMSLWFIVSLLIKRSDVADIAWGGGFVVLAWALYFNRPSVQLSLATLLITVWGVRLSLHIFLRNRRKTEDYRYQQWRKDWGKWFIPRSFGQIFMLQGLLLVLISAPVVMMGSYGTDNLGVVHILAVLLWLVGFGFETIGDYQLKQFLVQRRSKDEVMQTGLWRYSRHPNYFGEVLQWWAIWVLSWGIISFWWGLIGPLTISFLILKVSGVPMLEKKYQGNKQFENYKKQTSMFIPLPPRVLKVSK